MDRAIIEVESGAGGNGCISFRREKYVPRGGPDGGDGGRGGNVIIAADPHKHTLLDFHYQTRYRAGRGEHGSGSNKKGKEGEDRIVSVPPGTVVSDDESGEVLADLVEPGSSVVVARGGRGGWGNSHFATATERAPRKARDGAPSERRLVLLELKLIADVGLVGFPNAGKSTLLSRVSAARPKIADYPFTTLSPNLGLVRVPGAGSFVMADIPGLIEGASEGKGLGLEFLRHVERCRVLLYLVEATSENPDRDLQVLREEVRRYREDLLERPSLVLWTKIDTLSESAKKGEKGWPISSVTGAGLDEVLHEVYRLLQEGRDDGPG